MIEKLKENVVEKVNEKAINKVEVNERERERAL